MNKIRGCNADFKITEKGRMIVECNPPDCQRCGFSQQQPTIDGKKLLKRASETGEPVAFATNPDGI